jgi:hypothetical protein
VVRTVRGAVVTAALAVSTFALTPGAAFADAAHHPGKHPEATHVSKVSVSFTCDHCTIYGDVYSSGKDNIVGNGNGNGNGNDSLNGNANGNTLGGEHKMPEGRPGIGLPGIGLPGIGVPFPNANFSVQTDYSVRGLVRTSQEGDVGEFFPYPMFLGPNYNVSLPHVLTKAVYSSEGDRGHVTLATNLERVTCAADGNLRCNIPESRDAFNPIIISQQ